MSDTDSDDHDENGGEHDMIATTLSEAGQLDDTRVVDPTQGGALGDDPETEISVATDVEETLLTALMWARAETAGRILSAIEAKHFWRPVHVLIATAIADVAATTAPSPALVNVRLMETGAYRGPMAQQLRSLMVSLAAPTDRPVTHELAITPLAVALLDAWYRRGYTALLRRMEQHRLEASVEELGDCWAQLTRFQQRAEADWMARRQRLTAQEDR